MPPGSNDITSLLLAWSEGDRGALDRLVPLIYEDLRRLAHAYMSRERRGHTLQTTALVHEAFERLVDKPRVHWRGRAHFLAVCAQLMRRVLVDYARSRGYLKRGGGAEVGTIDEALHLSAGRARDLVAIDDALAALEKLDAPQEPRGGASFLRRTDSGRDSRVSESVSGHRDARLENGQSVDAAGNFGRRARRRRERGMTPGRWQRLDRLYQAALDTPPGARNRFLREAAAGEPDLLQEVEEMLALAERERSFLERPALGLALDGDPAAARELRRALGAALCAPRGGVPFRARPAPGPV